MIGTLLDPVLGAFTDDPTRLGLGVSMIAIAFYYRRMLGVALVAKSILTYIVFGVVAIGILIILGIIPTVNIDVALGYAVQVFELLRGYIPL